MTLRDFIKFPKYFSVIL